MIKTILSACFQDRRSKSLLVGLVTLFALSATGAYWYYARTHMSTENSYVNADAVHIASEVKGAVLAVNIDNYQTVEQGDLLIEIDPKPFQAQVEEARAKVAQGSAKLNNSQANLARVEKLVERKFLPPEEKDNALTAMDVAMADLKFAQASLLQAELNLNHTKIYAPTTGIVQNLTLRPGSVIPANLPLFVIIDTEKFWVDANFKETQLTHIKIGQPATIKVDMYPQHVFEGIVENISGSSGTAFSLLPPQNASGNWVKVTQRIPVKVRIQNPDEKFPLRVGSTATVTVNVSKP